MMTLNDFDSCESTVLRMSVRPSSTGSPPHAGDRCSEIGIFSSWAAAQNGS